MWNGGLTFRLFFLVFLRPGLAIPLSNSGSRESQGLGCERYHTRRGDPWISESCRTQIESSENTQRVTNLDILGDIWWHLISEFLHLTCVFFPCRFKTKSFQKSISAKEAFGHFVVILEEAILSWTSVVARLSVPVVIFTPGSAVGNGGPLGAIPSKQSRRPCQRVAGSQGPMECGLFPFCLAFHVMNRYMYIDLIRYKHDKHVYGTDAWSDGMMKRTKAYKKN